MIYHLLLKLVKCVDNNHKYNFAYWWIRIFSFFKYFNPITSPLPSYPVDIMNLHFPNPVGLAAGFDRDGSLISNLNSSGFGSIEIGTINVNSENNSSDKLSKNIRNLVYSRIKTTNKALIGISLGSLRNNINDHTVADYLLGMKLYWPYSDYIVINLSRPGSSMRSETRNNNDIRFLLEKIKQEHTALCEKHNKHVPIVIKVAINYDNRKSLPETLMIVKELNFDGLLIAFEHWPSSIDVVTTVDEISTLTQQLPLIVVGGIKTEDDMLQILNAGAHLVQCYNLLVDQGPAKMKKAIHKLTLLAKDKL
jgi:dihydroorotate dehydrogenase